MCFIANACSSQQWTLQGKRLDSAAGNTYRCSSPGPSLGLRDWSCGWLIASAEILIHVSPFSYITEHSRRYLGHKLERKNASESSKQQASNLLHLVIATLLASAATSARSHRRSWRFKFRSKLVCLRSKTTGVSDNVQAVRHQRQCSMVNMKSAVVLSGEALPGRSHRAWCRERFETWKREKKMQASLSVLSSPETTKFTDGFRVTHRV